MSKLRFQIVNHDSHKVLFAFKITKVMLIVTLVVIILAIMVGTYFLTANTVLRETIPGYPTEETKQMAVENIIKIDSLERVIEMWSFQISNIQRVVTGQEPLGIDSIMVNRQENKVDESKLEIYAKSDSLLRDEVKKQEQFNLSYNQNQIKQIEGLHFFTPVKGIITDGFNLALNHPYVDIAATAGTVVYSILDGTVISAGWNDDTGYTMQIQHDNDIISVYRHNEQLLKGTGDKVKAGTPVALVGSTGKLSTGAHLHFEMWHKGEAVDPTLYIKF